MTQRAIALPLPDPFVATQLSIAGTVSVVLGTAERMLMRLLRRYVGLVGIVAGLLAALPALPGVAYAAGPLSWSSPLLVDHKPPYATGGSASAVSCPSAKWCAAVDDVGDVITSTRPTGPGSSWKVVHFRFRSLTGISCPSVSFCAAVDSAGDVLVSRHPRGRAWTIAHVDRYTASAPGQGVPNR